jgi:Ca2+-binding EF-hand superfamily protein
MTYSNSAPKLDTDISKEARRIRRKLAASGVMPEKITSPDKIRERLKYVLRDLDRDVQSALDQAKHKRKKGAPLSKTGTEDDMTLEEKADQEKMEAEERMLKEKRRSERRAALKNKLHFGTYTKEHIMHMREKFKNMDQDESGSIDLDEFLEAQNASHISDHMASMFHAMDIDGDGNVSLREMCSVVFHKAPPRELKDIVAFLSMKKTPRLEVEVINPITQEEVEELRQIFDLYDEDGGGFLDRMEIYKALGVVSGYSAQTGLSLKELDDMIDEADVDGGGTIDKEEFVNMMSQVTHGVATFDPW